MCRNGFPCSSISFEQEKTSSCQARYPFYHLLLLQDSDLERKYRNLCAQLPHPSLRHALCSAGEQKFVIRAVAAAEEQAKYGVLLEVDKALVDTHTQAHRVAFNQAFKVLNMCSHNNM